MTDASPKPSLGERIAFAPVPLWAVSLLVLFGLAGAVWFGWRVKTPQRKGHAHAIAMRIAGIPDTLRQMRHQRTAVPLFRPYYGGAYEPRPEGFSANRGQPLVDPGYLLLTAFDDPHRRAEVQLRRLSDGAVLHRYVPDIATLNARSHFTSALVDLKREKGPARNLMMHPLLLPDGGLVIHDGTPLAKIDPCGKVLWEVDGIFHHSLELGPEGHLWAAYRYPRSPLPKVSPTFIDEAVAEVTTDGKLLRLIRVADILDDNDLGYLWRHRLYSEDPFHLNDVQPVYQDGRYWRRGDLFLSLRGLSMLMLYRPSTGKVLWWRMQPWSAQHDVSVVDDHRISVFDNNWDFAAPEGDVAAAGNRVLVYDFDTDRTEQVLAEGMRKADFYTRAQGRATPLANGDFMLEETERGRVLRMAPDGTLRWEYISADASMRRYQLRWSRYLDPQSNQAAVRAAEETKCETTAKS
ncbi:MAG: arylsulfotransferase family protein [Pseudoxanthomonas sp.]